MTDNPAFKDAFDLLCGEKLGSGVSRDVFECRLRPDLVVKVEVNEAWRSFANVKEMAFWDDNCHAPSIARWLAPCEYLSPDGRILLQKRVRIATVDDALPETLPRFLTDTKRANYGWIGEQLVCVDYAGVVPGVSQRHKKVVWW